MKLMAPKTNPLLKIPDLGRSFETDMVDLTRPDVGAFRRDCHRRHTVGVAAEEEHLFGLPLLDADLIAHGVHDVVAIWVEL